MAACRVTFVQENEDQSERSKLPSYESWDRDTLRLKDEQRRKRELSANREGLRPLGPVSTTSDTFYIYNLHGLHLD